MYTLGSGSQASKMEFGLYVDPIVLTQRHTLYDSDEEETETEKTGVAITVSSTQSDSKVLVSEGGTLLVGVGLTASIFAQSYPLLADRPCCSIVANSQTVFQGKYFPPKGQEVAEKVRDDVICLSELYAVKSEASREEGNCFVCVHEKPLKPEYCNAWASKVCDNVCTCMRRCYFSRFELHNLVPKLFVWRRGGGRFCTVLN